MPSFIEYDVTCEFPLENLPFGVFSDTHNSSKRVGVAIGNSILDLAYLALTPLISRSPLSASDASELFCQPTINDYISKPRLLWREFRTYLQKLLDVENKELADNAKLRNKLFVLQSNAIMHMPIKIGAHIPIGYHGRSSTIVPTGSPIHRPSGQYREPGNALPVFGPSKQLDYELEMGYVIGGPSNALGQPVSVDEASERVFGAVLMNDWSARDVQGWESLPLGPFLGKNFGTTISPWVVQIEALDLVTVEPPKQTDPSPLPYLQENDGKMWDVRLKVEVRPSGVAEWSETTESNLKNLYWTANQMVAHHSVGGCILNAGDVLATGTISGPGPANLGCLLERTHGGAKSFKLSTGEERTWLLDGDEVRLTGYAQGNGFRIGFGEAVGKVKSTLWKAVP